MKSSFTFFLITVMLCLHVLLRAEESNSFESIHQQAISAYNGGNYSEALKSLKSLYAAGNTDPDLLYNLGNAASMVGNPAEALLYYEKALRFKPSDHAILNAIHKERESIENGVIAGNPFFLMRWMDNILSLFRPGIWAGIGLLLILGSLIQWLSSMRVSGSRKSSFPGKFWLYPVMGSVFILIALFAYFRLYRLNEGVVFTPCELKQGPSLQSPQLRMVSVGEKVKVSDGLTGWYKVSLLNMDEGWINKDCLRIIDMREFK